MKNKLLQGTVVNQLPAGVMLRGIQDHAELRTTLDNAWGETHLLVHSGRLVVLTRSSILDPYEPVEIDPEHIPRLESETFQCDLFIKLADGSEGRLAVSNKERESIEAFLERLKKRLA